MSTSTKEVIVDKLARCVDSKYSYKDRLNALKTVFGNIQDTELKQTVQQKNILVSLGGIETLINIMNIKDPSVPMINDPKFANIDIYDRKGPEWRYMYILQAHAALSMRRMLQVGCREASSGLRRIERAVSAGVIPCLIPHLHFTQYGSEYSSGRLKVLSQYEQYREVIIAAEALAPLCKLIQCDPVAEKSSFRNAVECLHLISCSSVQAFQDMGILQACLTAAANPLSGDKGIICSALCAANIAAGRDGGDGSGIMDTLYCRVQLGLHICRALHMSLTPGPMYLHLAWSQMDILHSICLLAASTAGCSQLITSRVKEDVSNRQVTIVDVLCSMLKLCVITQQEKVEVILEIFLHLSFREDGKMLLRTSLCLGLLGKLSIVTENDAMQSESDQFYDENDVKPPTVGVNRECTQLAKNVLFVLNGNLDNTTQATVTTSLVPSSLLIDESCPPILPSPTPYAAPNAPTYPAPSLSLSSHPARRGGRLRNDPQKAYEGTNQPDPLSPSGGHEHESYSHTESDDKGADMLAEQECEGDEDNDCEELTDVVRAERLAVDTTALESDLGAVEDPLYYPHIMISYSWAQQDIILEICKHLKAAGLAYWLDVEQMHGNINDRMAEAIEGCSVVLMGISSRYKLSANCRMEAEYSQTKHKPIVPIKVEAEYMADGWLGLLTSGKLWYDATSLQAVETNISDIIAAVRPIVTAAGLREHPKSVSGSATKLTTAIVEMHVPDNEGNAVAGTNVGYIHPLPAKMESADIETIARIMQRFRDEIIDSIETQLVPIVDSIQLLDSRLKRIESELANERSLVGASKSSRLK